MSKFDTLRMKTRKFLKEHKMTQCELGEYLNITGSSVNTFLKGKTRLNKQHTKELKLILKTADETRQPSLFEKGNEITGHVNRVPSEAERMLTESYLELLNMTLEVPEKHSKDIILIVRKIKSACGMLFKGVV